MEKTIIVIDAMGGDYAPHETVKGAVESLSNEEINLVLVGRQDEIEKELAAYNYDKNRLSIQNASEIINAGEVPTAAIKQKKDSSMVVGLNLVKNGLAHGFVSAGSTGALLTGATVIIGRINGIERPALAVMLPNKNGYTFLLDCGANIDSKPSYLLQFAKMGSIYMENVAGVKNPRVGLVNIGTEKEKGNMLTKEAYGIMEGGGFNFCGNIEAGDIVSGKADVAVCDAFIGNIILKNTESITRFMLESVKKEMENTMLTEEDASFAKKTLYNIKNKFNFSDVGGAPFLGLNALVVKAHGNSDARAIAGAVNQCYLFNQNELVKRFQNLW